MFAVLQVLPYERDVISRIRERRHPAEPELKEVAVKNGAPFFIVKVKRRKDGIPWSAVKRTAGFCANRLLLPEGLVPEEGSGIHVFAPEKLPARLLFNSACNVLSHTGKRPPEMSVCVVDINAELAEDISRLFCLASTVRAVTLKPEIYEPVAEKIMDTYGATLVITDDIGSAQRSTAVIAPRYNLLSGRERGIVFTLSQPGCDFGSSRPVVTGAGVQLPAEYSCLKPPDVEDYAFACALFDLCGVRSLGSLAFEMLFVNSKPSGLYATARLV